jgi:putative FmdB family regulatory protein
MPIYEYKCQDCQWVFEKLIRSLSATDPIHCEKCQSSSVIKLISNFAYSGGSKSPSDQSAPSHSCGSCSSSNCSSCGH